MANLNVKQLFTNILNKLKSHDNKIGDTTMGTTATTITGAIAEHEQDISNLNSKNIKLALVNHRELAANTTKASGAISNYGEVALSEPGLYILTTQTSGDNFNGRMFSSFAGTDLAVEFMPVTVSGFSLINTFQLMSITDTPKTVTRQYWTSANTGTKHIYDIYKVYI